MRSKEELQAGVAKIFADLRARKNLSKCKMAELVNVDYKTWRSWEAGETTPSIVDFMSVFEHCNETMMRPVLNLLYPELYSAAGQDIEQMRRATAEFFRSEASDHMVRVWYFLHAGDHGSNILPQVEEFCAFDHLPMEYRYFIAEQIYVSYMIAMHRGELIATDEVLPDMDIWTHGLKQGQRSAFKKLQSYTTIGGDEK